MIQWLLLFLGEDLIQRTDVRSAIRYSNTNVTLLPGVAYYASVRGFNNVGHSITATSDGFKLDNEEPIVGK